jgi:cysteine desulfuration protein SufE
MEAQIPPALQEIIDEFQWCEGAEKLELLIQYAQDLPDLPAWLQADRSQMEPIPECMTPVSVQSSFQGGRLSFYFDVPAESPMVRGYASLMRRGLDGATPAEVLAVPADFFYAMGLHQVLSHQRLNGISAILAHMKQLALKALASTG